MKQGFLAILSLLSQLAVGQGTIRFTNIGEGLDAPIYTAAGSLVPTNGTTTLAPGICAWYVAELLVGDSPTTLAPVPTFASFTQPGYFGMGAEAVVVPYPPGSHPWFLVAVSRVAGPCITTWEVPGEPLEKGCSVAFQLDPNGPGLGDGTPAAPPPLLLGLGSFRLETVEWPPPWVAPPLVWGGSFQFYWGGPRTFLRETTLQSSPGPLGPWTTLANAPSPYIEPYDAGISAFFRAVTVLQAIGTPIAGSEPAPAFEPPVRRSPTSSNRSPDARAEPRSHQR